MVDFVRQIAIGCDHAGFHVKEHIRHELQRAGYPVNDVGVFSEDPADYPDYAGPVSRAVRSGESRFGVLVCGTGNGMAIAANKYTGIRAALCWTDEIARLARLHNDANIIVLPARFISPESAWKMVSLFLSEPFEGGRHQRRIDKIDRLS